MHFKKPCQICNVPKAGLANSTSLTAAAPHNAHLKNRNDCYELWVYVPGIVASAILVYLKSETIEVFEKAVFPEKEDLLLLLLPIPQNIKTESISVKKIEDGIVIMMPKNEKLKRTKPVLLPIEL